MLTGRQVELLTPADKPTKRAQAKQKSERASLEFSFSDLRFGNWRHR